MLAGSWNWRALISSCQSALEVISSWTLESGGNTVQYVPSKFNHSGLERWPLISVLIIALNFDPTTLSDLILFGTGVSFEFRFQA